MTTLLTPAYRLTVGHRVVDTTVEPKASATTDLIVTLDLDAWLDTAVLYLGQVGGLSPALDDEATVELGYADDGGFTQVFDGYVDVVEPGLLTRRITAASPARALARLFLDQTYEGQTAGAIVTDLAGQVNIGLATIDDGITFPAYVIDSKRPALAHIRDLAALSGVDAYTDSDGKLVFQAFTAGNIVHDVDYAKQILALEVDRSRTKTGVPEPAMPAEEEKSLMSQPHASAPAVPVGLSPHALTATSVPAHRSTSSARICFA